jgi:hypothetical protein
LQPPLDHVVAMSDDVGMIQHAVASTPDTDTGYCTDDVARAFMVVSARALLQPNDLAALRLAGIYFTFLRHAQVEDGRFRNFMDYEKQWLEEVGSNDSNGRAMWGLGYGMRYAPTQALRGSCAMLMHGALQCIEWLEFPHAETYAILGLCDAYDATAQPEYADALRWLAARAVRRYRENADEQWQWFEPTMTYDNARLPEALLRAGQALRDDNMVAIAEKALAFLEAIVFEPDGVFVPIGNDGWFSRGGERARYAQQPLEAAAMVDAEIAAGNGALAQAAFEWYRGRNSRSIVMVTGGGGCYDGLSRLSVNPNMGAESTLAYLSAAYALALRQKPVPL